MTDNNGFAELLAAEFSLFGRKKKMKKFKPKKMKTGEKEAYEVARKELHDRLGY